MSSPSGSPAHQDTPAAGTLQRLALDGAPADRALGAAFDRVARIAAAALRAPVAVVCIIDEGEARVVGHHVAGVSMSGADDASATLERACEACASTVFAPAPDRDGAGATAAAPGAPLGVPIVTADGAAVGGLCVMDDESRVWSSDDHSLLTDLAITLVSEVALRSALAEHARLDHARSHMEAMLRGLANQSLTGNVVGQDGRAIFVNQRYAEIFGYTTDEILAMPDTNGLVLESERPIVAEMMRGRLAGEGDVHYQTVGQRSDGSTVPIEVYGSSFILDGRLATTATVLDVSARARAEAALRESEERFRALSVASPVGIFNSNGAGQVTYANPRLLQIWGMSEERMLGHGWIDQVHPDDREELVAAWLDALSNEREYEREYRLLLGDGSLRWVHGRSAPLHNGTGGVVGTIEDVTERRTSEDRVHARERHFRALIEHASDMTAVIDAAGMFTYVSPGHVSSLGYAPEYLEGLPALDLVHPDDRGAATAMIDLVSTQPGQSARLQLRYRHRDGMWRTIVTVATNLLHESAVRGVVLNSHDVTERVDLEGQVRQAQRMEAVGRLAGGVAHDFNNLLTVIRSYSDLALDAIDPAEPVHADVLEVRKAADRAATLTRQLLAFGRKQVLQPRRMNVNHKLADLQSMLERLIGEHIVFEIRYAADPWPLRTDPGQLEQVLVNLVVNARDAMPEGGTLAMRTENVRLDTVAARELGVAPGCYVSIEVQDSGTGIDPLLLPHIFEPFFTTKDMGKGTGLGLATVYGIVQQSGGHVRVHSLPDEGSRFTVLLPRDESETIDPAIASEMRMPYGTETILLVEDETAVRAAVRRMLERQGYTVLEAGDGMQALAVWQSHGESVDLVLTDAVMPVLGGSALIARLRAERPDVRIIVMTGYTADVASTEALLATGASFLQKPVTPEVLLSCVRDSLDR
jgi:PAS domain S-box-containing protein